MATLKNSTCARCKNLVSPLAIYCEYCGCCFDTRIGLPRLVAKLFIVILAFLLGSGIATYSLNVRRDVSEASVVSLPVPKPTISATTSSQGQLTTPVEEIATDNTEEPKQEESHVSREEFLRKEAELKEAQEALAELQRYLKAHNLQQAELPAQTQPKVPDENIPSSLAPKNKMESPVLIRTPNPTSMPPPTTQTMKPESSLRHHAP